MTFRSFPKSKKAAASYNNLAQTCTLHGSHRSKLESAVCALLQWREKAGELEIVQAEDHVYLSRARILYVADFKCRDKKTGEFFWVEAKGFESPLWPTKKKLWKFYGPGVLEVWKGSWSRPVLDETIMPKGDER